MPSMEIYNEIAVNIYSVRTTESSRPLIHVDGLRRRSDSFASAEMTHTIAHKTISRLLHINTGPIIIYVCVCVGVARQPPNRAYCLPGQIIARRLCTIAQTPSIR